MATASPRRQADSPPVNAGTRHNAHAVIPRGFAKIFLNDQGIILDCSPTCEQVFGCQQDELEGRHVSALLPHLENTELVLEDRINSRLAFLCHCAMPFKARHGGGHFLDIELFINRLGSQNVVLLMRVLDRTA